MNNIPYITGRPTKDRKKELEERKRVALKMLSEGVRRADIARYFKIHPSNITRLLNKDEK